MNAVHFLISTLFDLYIMVVVLRVWLQLARADFYNPFSQFVVKATNPFLIPMRRIIPGVGGVDLAGILLAVILMGVKITVIQLMFGVGMPPVVPLILSSVLGLVAEVLQLMIYVLIIRAILSWVSQGYNPIEMVLGQLTEPLLRPIRSIIPPMGGLDLSVMVLIILIIFLQKLFADFVGMI